MDDIFERDDLVARPPETDRMKMLRERAERVEQLRENPPLREALLKAMAWQRDIEEKGMRRSEIARRERYTRARVTQIMKLVELPEDVKGMILVGDEAVAGWTVRKGIEVAAG